VKQVVNKAAAGDPRMLNHLLKVFGDCVEIPGAKGSTPETVLGGEDDQRLLEMFRQNWSADDETE